ncbi:MAG TPA: putative RNA uridine N3 methyltransferase [Candidatus Bathyarchaeia archaeon]|nr:putative RNA uridine N3 methyltransferase [Candidatus Bathyarchaeia archaeon]
MVHGKVTGFMRTAPKRRQHGLSVALPASLTLDVPHLREKTARIGMIARTLAIFRVDEVIIYTDEQSEKAQNEGRLLEQLLSYQETPQYLRKLLFKRSPEYEFAGTLPPLRTPNHPNRSPAEAGEVRDAVVLQSGEESQVDAGFGVPVTVAARLRKFDRVTIRLTRVSPRLAAELVKPRKLAIYWGFRVSRRNVKLSELVKSRREELTISTSREGTDIRHVLKDLTLRWNSASSSILLFGSPREGIPEILARDKTEVSQIADFNLNTVPEQGVETVRTEEAVLATLSALNVLEIA